MSSYKKKSTSRKRTSRKRKPKINLNKSSVLILTGAIALFCVLILAFSIIINQPPLNKTKSNEKVAIEKDDITIKQKSSPTVKNSSSKNSNSVKEEKKITNNSIDIEKKNNSTSTKNNTSSVKNTSPSTNIKKTPEKSIKPPVDKKDNTSGNKNISEPYNIPIAKNNATLIFIFDDAGQNTKYLNKYLSLPFPLTIAVLPGLAHSKDCADLVRKSGKEVMLHQPMQALNLNVNPGPCAIGPDMSTFEIAEIIKKNIQDIGPVKGVNNHEGSLITSDIIKIGAVLDITQELNIYFVDSRTTVDTKASQAALERDVQILERDVFLDDVVNKQSILKEMYRALGIANKNGTVIIIGHVDKSADIIPALLQDMYPYLVSKGYKFTFPSMIK